MKATGRDSYSFSETGITTPDGIPLITTHWLWNKDRTPEELTSRLMSLLPEGGKDSITEEQQKEITATIGFVRILLNGQERKGTYFEIFPEGPTDFKKPTVAHTEGTAELVASMLNLTSIEPKYYYLVIVAALLHDCPEDAKGESETMTHFLSLHFNPGEIKKIIFIILQLSKPDEDILEFHTSLVRNSAGIYMEGLSRAIFSTATATKLIENVGTKFSNALEKQWKDTTTIPGAYRAPIDPQIPLHIARELENHASVEYRLKEVGFDESKIINLFRFIEHSLFAWCTINKRPISEGLNNKNLMKRICLDLSAILQVTLSSEYMKKNDELQWLVLAIQLIKFCDQLYNGWDISYILQIKDEDKLKEAIIKITMMAIRIQQYYYLAIQEVNRVSPQLTELLQWVLEYTSKILQRTTTSLEVPSPSLSIPGDSHSL